jgi:hypothetical protein
MEGLWKIGVRNKLLKYILSFGSLLSDPEINNFTIKLLEDASTYKVLSPINDRFQI